MDKYKHKLPKDDLKRFAKQVRTTKYHFSRGAIDLTFPSGCKETGRVRLQARSSGRPDQDYTFARTACQEACY